MSVVDGWDLNCDLWTDSPKPRPLDTSARNTVKQRGRLTTVAFPCYPVPFLQVHHQSLSLVSHPSSWWSRVRQLRSTKPGSVTVTPRMVPINLLHEAAPTSLGD